MTIDRRSKSKSRPPPPSSSGDHNCGINSGDNHSFFDPSAAAAGVAGADDHIHQSDPHRQHHHPSRSTMMFRPCRRRCARLHPGSVSNLCSATLGAGALSLPFAVSLTGIVFGVLLLLFSAYITVVSIDAIIDSCRRTKLFQYEDVSMRLVGPGVGRVLEASLLVFCFGTAVAYIIAVGDILDQGLRSIPYLWGPNNSEENIGWSFTSIYSRERGMILFWGLVMFPLSLQRHVEALERFSPLGVLSIIFLVMAAVIHSIAHGDIIGIGDDSQQHSHPTTDIGSMMWPKSFWDVVQAFPIIIFAFSCQVNVCAIFEELTPEEVSDAFSSDMSELKSKQRTMGRITRNGITLCVTLYICIGLFGFLDFSHGTVDNILNNYCIQATHNHLMIAASVFVAVAIVVAFPFNILPARVTLKLILERFRRRRRCDACNWYGRKSRPDGDYVTPMEVDEAAVSPPNSPPNGDEAMVNGLDVGVTDPLLDSDMFDDRPCLIPHMSLEGLPPEEAEELYSTDSPPVEHFLLTLFLSGSALIVALLIPGISVVFGLMGGSAASIISFILPGMFLMEAYTGVTGEENTRLSKQMQLLGQFFVVGGSLMGVLSTGVTIYGLFSPRDSPVDACNGV